VDESLPETINVVIATRIHDPEAYMERIRALAPGRIHVKYAWGEFIPEMRREWPDRMMRRNAGEAESSARGDAEREAMLANTHVMLFGVPFPMHVPPRAPRLRWAHFTFAGISNLKGSDWWEVPCAVTSSRGFTGARPIAESVIAAAMMFARRLDLAAINTNQEFKTNLVPPMISVEGKTMGIVGLGGIGNHVAQMARALGMRVVATRRSVSAVQHDVDGVDTVYPINDTHRMLAESDFVAVCAMWTPETEGMFDSAAFAAMKPGAFFINIARGELVQEPALIEALASERLAGAYLDVWPDDFATPPNPELLKLPNVVITPHISGRADASFNFGTELFIDNLRRLINGEALVNQVDWSRAY